MLARARGKITFYALSHNENEGVVVFAVRHRRETNIHIAVARYMFPQTKHVESVVCLEMSENNIEVFQN